MGIQPAPAGDDELSEAVLDVVKAHGGTEDIADAERFVAKYDERGRELERLRARDEKAAAVLEEYAMHGLHRLDVLAVLLDELARAHEQDGGQHW